MDTRFDEALEILGGRAFEYADGMSNHGPMAAEALYRLGLAHEAAKWARGYGKLLEPQPAPVARIDDWQAALGKYARGADWIVLFESEFRDASWSEVLDKWASRLAPGLVGAAFHGFIRTGHAVRALAEAETPPRMRELAEALSYWAASYQPLPDAHLADGGWSPSEALPKVEMLPPEERMESGNITERLAPVLSSKPFSYAASLVDTSADPNKFLADLTRLFARVYLANRQDFVGAITFIHTITAPAAALLLVPHVQRTTARQLLRYAWQGNAALYASIAASTQVPAPDDSAQRMSREELIDRALSSGDEHAIKFTEACLRMHALNPDPVYLIAASDAVKRLVSPPWWAREKLAAAAL